MASARHRGRRRAATAIGTVLEFPGGFENGVKVQEATGARVKTSLAPVRGSGAGLAERLAAAYLDRLAKDLTRADAVAERDVLRSLGWLVACREDARLPVDVAARLVPGFSTHPAVQSLARFLLMRSVRCRRMRQAYRDQARAMLHLQREKLHDDFRPALWLGVLHLLEGRLSEAHRAFEAAERPAAGDEAVACALACSKVLLGELRAASPWRRRLEEMAQRDPALAALMRARAGAGKASWTGLRLELVLAGALPRPQDSSVTLEIRAVTGGRVSVRGPGGQRWLTPLEGELLLALLSLTSPAPPASEVPASREPEGDGGAGPESQGPRSIRRERWTGAIWPSTSGAVGRMDGLFSAVIRSLRLKALTVARRPVLEVSRRGFYELLPDSAIRLTIDLPSLLANWLLSRTPSDPAAGALVAAEG